jgi:diamine N-acetyltransferase
VSLVPVTPGNREAVGALTIHRSQERFVSPMLVNFRDALIPPVVNGAPVMPWFRAIEADGEVVGFLLAAEVTPAHPRPVLWRLLVDRMQQRRGIGTAVLDEFERRCRDGGATTVEAMWVEGRGSPGAVFRARGYEPTGQVRDGEVLAAKWLT